MTPNPDGGPCSQSNSSESPHHSYIPRVWLQEPKIRYLEKADNFLNKYEFKDPLSFLNVL